jgi:hypothetical protein
VGAADTVVDKALSRFDRPRGEVEADGMTSRPPRILTLIDVGEVVLIAIFVWVVNAIKSDWHRTLIAPAVWQVPFLIMLGCVARAVINWLSSRKARSRER